MYNIQSPPPSIKVIKNPKTGKLETVEAPRKVNEKALADLHQEVKDMISGNKQFHDDPYSAGEPAPAQSETGTTQCSEDDPDWNHMYLIP